MNIPLAQTEVPTKLIVFGVFGVIWLLTAIFGKKSTTVVPTTPRRAAPAPAPVQASVQASKRQQQFQQRVAEITGVATTTPPPMPKQRGRGKAKPQPVTVTQAAQLARQAAQARPKPTVAAPIAMQARATNETAKNLRLLLQRGGVRESVLLAEILGAPKSMRE